MKILSAEQTHRADAYSIGHEPVRSIDLMERAAEAFVNWFIERFPAKRPIHIFCGTGNNGGDGLAIARLLRKAEYHINVYVLRKTNNTPLDPLSRGETPRASDDFLFNEGRLKTVTDISIVDIGNDFPALKEDSIIVDALFGTGLSRPLEGMAVALVEHLNALPSTRIAIDIPSGLYADRFSPSVKFHAHHTFTFELPKLSFLLPDNEKAVGDWHIGSIGLHQDFIDHEAVNNYFTTGEDIRLKARPKFSHKGTYGHAVIVSGSFGKIGAAILSSQACLKSGAGLVTLYTAKCGYTAVQCAVPEAMAICSGENFIDTAIDTSTYSAVGIGPGIGTEKATADALYHFITHVQKPMVLDADALNIISQNPTWLSVLPKGSILTPHPKEFERLFGPSENGYDRIELLRTKAVEHGLHIILKGANTAIACPDGSIHFNSTGNPGMATGGSGDVLTGIITGLLAQGYEPKQASISGVYLHGLAGDIAAEETGMEALIAGDIIKHLGTAFQIVHSVSE